jgi:molybdate transport system permease protein
MHLSADDWSAIRLTLELACIVTLLLLLVGTPIAWWLATTRSRLRNAVGAVVALPIVLPPTVLGFYLLIVMGPDGPVGMLTRSLGLGGLPFTFAGLVVASVFYSLPFVVQPIQNAFMAMGPRPLEVAATCVPRHGTASSTSPCPLPGRASDGRGIGVRPHGW